MKHIARVNGTFFDWELTVRVRPAEGSPVKITEPDEGSAIARMKRVGRYFHDMANLHEYSMEFEIGNRSSVQREQRG